MTSLPSSGAPPSEPSPSSSLDLGRAIGFFFEDPDWISKLLVGSLFALLSPMVVGSVFITGFAVQLARKARRGDRPALPEWSDLAEIFMDGLKGLAIYVGHALPLAVLFGMLALAVGGGSVLIDRTDAVPNEFQEGLVLLGLLGGSFLFFVVFLAMVVYVPAAFARYVQTDRLGAAFELKENVEFIRADVGQYAMGLLAILLAGFVAQLGFLFFCIGVFPASFWSTCVAGFVIGELLRLRESKSDA